MIVLIRPRSEMDITRRFGRRILGSNPGGGTTIEKTRLLRVFSIVAGRSGQDSKLLRAILKK